MSVAEISIELRLNVLADNKVMVPGCEPISDATSQTLAQRVRFHCPCALVNVQDVLNAIPGSRLEFGLNFDLAGCRQRWVVLPPRQQDCCVAAPDYYKIIRGLCRSEEPEFDKFEYCDTLGQGYCPSPGWDRAVPPDPSPYLSEGTVPYGQSVTLGPWVPPWQAGNP